LQTDAGFLLERRRRTRRIQRRVRRVTRGAPTRGASGASPPPAAAKRGEGFKMLRILVLLLVLLFVALMTWQERYLSTRWQHPLYVSIYPIAADESPVTRAYLASIQPELFKPVDRFFTREAERYRLQTDEPFRTRLRAELHPLPPQRA